MLNRWAAFAFDPQRTSRPDRLAPLLPSTESWQSTCSSKSTPTTTALSPTSWLIVAQAGRQHSTAALALRRCAIR